MTDGRLVLLVSGPVPGNEGSAGEAAAGLLWELRQVAGVPVSAVLADPVAGPPPERDRPTTRSAPPHPRAVPETTGSAPAGAGPAGTIAEGGPAGTVPKGGPAGSIVELAVTGLFSAATVAAIARVAVAFVRRGAARQITLRDGRRSLSITDPSEETERAVREWLGTPGRGGTGAGSGAD